MALKDCSGLGRAGADAFRFLFFGGSCSWRVEGSEAAAAAELLAAAASLAAERVTLSDMRMGFCIEPPLKWFSRAKEP